MKTIKDTLIKKLKELGIDFREFSHPATFSVSESKEIRKDIPGEIVKSLFLKDETSQFYLICLPGEKRLNTKKIKTFFGKKEMFFSSPEELISILKVTPGNVSIFSILNSQGVILVLDRALFTFSFVGFHPNINTSTLILSRENLEKFFSLVDSKKFILEL